MEVSLTDFSNLIEYEKTYPVEIKHPLTGEDTGIRVHVVSSDSKRVVDAQRKAVSEYFRARAVAGDGDAPELPDDARITLINSIDSWEWGDASFGHISGAGPAAMADREYLVDHPNSGWIVAQISAGCANIENFTQPSPKSARRGSKKT